MSNITGTIRSVLGDVKVLRASGEEAMLKEGDVIANGDTVMTGADASAYIEFPAVDGKTPTEGILQANSSATLKADGDAANLEVAEGEFEVLSEGDNQVVAVTGGGMFGLFGAAALSGNLAAAAGAAGAAFVISNNDDDDEAAAPAETGSTPGSIETVASAAGPAGETVTQGYTDLAPVTTLTDTPLEALTPATDAAEPVVDATAPVTDAAEPVLTPVNTVGTDALDGAAPVTSTLDENLTPTTSAVADALAPATDVLLGNEDGQLSAAADTLPINVRVISENLAMGLDQAAPPLAEGLNQVTTQAEPVLTPLNDGLTQVADGAAPLFDGLKQVTDAMPMATEPLADGLQQVFDGLEPVLTPLNEGLAGAGGGDDGGAPADGPLPMTGTPLDTVFAAINDAIATLQAAAGGSDSGSSEGGPLPTTGTPLDVVFSAINDGIAQFQAAVGGDAGADAGAEAGPLPTTGTPLDVVINAINDGIAQFQAAAGGDAGGDAGADAGPLPTTGTPLDTVINAINGAAAGGGEGGGDMSVSAGLDMVSAAIADNAADTPLAPLADVVADAGDAVGSVGDVLSADDSQLSPLTNPLGGGLGTSDADGLSGVPGTLQDAGDALTHLTSAELEPLSALTEPLDGGLNTLADGMSQGGQALVDNGSSDPSGVAELFGELLGGSADGAADAPSSDGGPVTSGPLPTTDTPLDMVFEPINEGFATLQSALTGGGDTSGGSPADQLTALLDPSALPISADAIPEPLAGALDPILSASPF